ncbi:MAG: PAS domain S-box protein [Dehalococcoidia bacterium]|nr:PAS domain S-box protein [Dehalococcoidia bacterium]
MSAKKSKGQAPNTLRSEPESLYAAVVERANDGIIVTQDGILQFVNPNFARMVGYDDAELQGESFTKVLTPDSLKIIEERYEGRMWGKELQPTYEIDLLTKDGEILPVDVSTGVIEYQGKIADALILRDNTKRKREQETYRLIANCSLIGTYIVQDGIFIFVNTEFQRALGYSEAELLKMGPHEVVHPKDRERVRADAIASLKGERSDGYEFRTITKNGSIRHAYEKVASIEFGGRKATIGSYMDITGRKKIEAAAADIAAYYESIVCCIPEMLLTFNKGEELTFFNSACEQFVAQKADDLLGRPKWEIFEELNLLTPESITKVKGKLVAHSKDGNPASGIDVEALDRDGNRVPLIYSEAAIKDAYGQSVGEMVLLSNVSKMKRLEEKLVDTVEKLKASQEELSTPVIQVWDKILALPVIGLVDSNRAQTIMDVLLSRIVETQAEMVILDITGVSTVDTQVANHLIKTVEAANMLGTECVITGIRPETAQTMIRLGLEMDSFPTKRTLRDGLMFGLKKLGFEVKRAAR